MCRVFIVTLLVLGLTPAMAHHGTANYFDLTNIATVEGDVVSIAWRNPHVTLELRRTDDGGANEIWEIEGSSLNALARIGVGPDIVAVGDHICVTRTIRAGQPDEYRYSPSANC